VGKVIKTTDANNHDTDVLYDKFDRQIATYDATKHQTSATTYDAVDRVIAATDTFGKITTIGYLDAQNKRVTATPTGVITTEIFDVAGRTTTKNEQVGSVIRATHYDYDKRNRKTRVTDAEGGETKYEYTLDNQTKSVIDAAATPNKTEYVYDVAGRLLEEKSVLLGSRYYQYDLVNNRREGTDRNGRVTRYDYDNLNRVKSETWVGGSRVFTYTYDKNSNLLSADDGNIRYEYAYDQTDLVEKVDRIQAGKSKVSFEYEYDNVGNLTKAEEWIANNLTATTIYTYNSRNLNTQIVQTGPGLANKDVKFTYDPAGLNTIVERYVDGLLKVKTTNSYDAYGRLTGIKDEKNNAGTFTTIDNRIYDLDILDRLKTETVDGQSRSIVYDNTDQVKTVTGSNSEAYAYDKNGNRLNAGYVTGSGNRLLSDGVYTYDYDAEGNRTKRTKIVDLTVDIYKWDYRNRLESIVTLDAANNVLKTVGYEYDVDDQRVKKTVDGVVENYYIDRDQIVFVTDGSGMQTFHYLYGLNVDSVMAQDSSTGMLWSLADRLGSIDTLTDVDGNVVTKRSFDSFGRVLDETNPLVSFRYGYTGRELDLESGLNYYRARYFDSGVGRFISVDPLGFGAGDTNLYRYVSNNSTNDTDPSGMLPIPLLVLGGISLLGAGIGAFQNYSYQKAQLADGIHPNNIKDGEKAGVDIGNVAISAGFGAVVAPLVALGVAIEPLAAPLLVGAGILSGLQNHSDAQAEFKAGHTATALYHEKMAYVDIFTAGLFGKKPPSSPSMQSAFASGTASALNVAANAVPTLLGGTGAGLIAGSLFQHFFASNNTNNPGGNEQKPENLYGDDPGWQKAIDEEHLIKVGDDMLPSRQTGTSSDGFPETDGPTRGILSYIVDGVKKKFGVGSTGAYKDNRGKYYNPREGRRIKEAQDQVIRELNEQGVTDQKVINDVKQSLTHAEGLAAFHLRQNPHITEASININNSQVCRSCNRNGIVNTLAPGQKLNVTLPNGEIIPYERPK
jgi:RHS repeat-associated protein